MSARSVQGSHAVPLAPAGVVEHASLIKQPDIYGIILHNELRSVLTFCLLYIGDISLHFDCDGFVKQEESA